MYKRPKLNFSPINLRAEKRNGQTYVFSEVRGAFVALTPEEWVRRHLVAHLIRHCGASPRSIVEEFPVEINGMAQRADVVVLGAEARPLLLAECKSTDIDLSKRETLGEVFQQATRYNAVVQARYIILSNGLLHYCYESTPTGYVALRAFPILG